MFNATAGSFSSLADRVAGRLKKRKFTRREDLTSEIRLEIANTALGAQINGEWGTITHLAEEHGISRTFVYSLASILKEAALTLFGEKAKGTPFAAIRELSIQMMLAVRLEGRGSIGAISSILERFGLKLSSAGSISQTLSRIGALLPMTLSIEDGIVRYLVFTSDEIFAKKLPILITVDPISSAILQIELADSRKAEDWKKHFECLYENDWEAIYLVTDEGTGLCAGHAETEVLNDVLRQSDIYHAIAHRLGEWVNRLEAAAYKAIEMEFKCEKRWESAKSERVKNKHWEAYEQAVTAAAAAIQLYEDFRYLYLSLIQELQVFDANGHLRNREQAEAQIQAGLTLIEELDRPKITKAVSKIKRVLPDLFHYFDIAERVLEECQELCEDEEALKALCIAWQWGKAVSKAKKSERRKQAVEQEGFCLQMAEGLLQEDYTDIQKEVYSKLDEIVPSSALVECINSILRPYLNTTKNHVTQEQLNLIMYYHNHRRYREGKRKNNTPMEILTGQEQERDWMELLFDVIREKDPGLLLAS